MKKNKAHILLSQENGIQNSQIDCVTKTKANSALIFQPFEQFFMYASETAV